MRARSLVLGPPHAPAHVVERHDQPRSFPQLGCDGEVGVRELVEQQQLCLVDAEPLRHAAHVLVVADAQAHAVGHVRQRR
eukprot:2880608-Rhodomonas_salina.1